MLVVYDQNIDVALLVTLLQVLSNCTPKITFENLLEPSALPAKFRDAVSKIDYTSPVTKINVAVNKLPNFVADPSVGSGVMPHHRCTIHMVRKPVYSTQTWQVYRYKNTSTFAHRWQSIGLARIPCLGKI